MYSCIFKLHKRLKLLVSLFIVKLQQESFKKVCRYFRHAVSGRVIYRTAECTVSLRLVSRIHVFVCGQLLFVGQGHIRFNTLLNRR